MHQSKIEFIQNGKVIQNTTINSPEQNYDAKINEIFAMIQAM